MRILPYAAVDLSRKCPGFWNKSWLSLFWAVVILWAIALFVLLPKPQGDGSWWGLLPGLLGLLFFVLMLERLRICRKRDAWLVRMDPEGLLINLRSFQNYHLPGESHRVLLLEPGEVAAICKTHETRLVPDRRGAHKDQYSFIDIYLHHTELGALREALRAERRVEAPAGWFKRAKRLHYPVRLLDPPGVRIVWDWVRPGENRSLDILGTTYPIGPDQKTTAKRWEKMSPEEREALLLEFWEWGHVEDAIRLGKMLWNVGDHRARKKLEEQVARS